MEKLRRAAAKAFAALFLLALLLGIIKNCIAPQRRVSPSPSQEPIETAQQR